VPGTRREGAGDPGKGGGGHPGQLPALTGNRLTVSGKREEETRREEERFFALERSYGSFSRSFTLPDGVDPDSAQAEMKGKASA